MWRTSRNVLSVAVAGTASFLSPFVYNRRAEVVGCEGFPPPHSPRIAAAFIQDEGVTNIRTLLNKYMLKNPERFAESKSFVSHWKLVLAHPPMKDKTLAKVASQLGRPVDLKPLALVTDENLQVLLVDVVKLRDDDDGGISKDLLPMGEPLHVVLAKRKGSTDERYTEFYSHQLLQRVVQQGVPFTRDWQGTLKAGHGFEETFAEVRVLSNLDAHMFSLPAVICISDQWANDKCGEPQCGFCRFMKLGPCGKEFERWEACVHDAKENDADFVERCGEKTWEMKECVDANPEYYMAITEGGEEEELELVEVEQNPPLVDLAPIISN